MVASVSDTQQQLEELEPSDKEYRRLLYVLLNHQDLRSHVQGLHGSSLEGFIELLDKALNHISVTDDLFRKTLSRLQSICSNREVLPQSYIIPSEKLLNRGQAIASGSFFEVHAAELDGEKVCIKALRLYIQDTRGAMKKVFYREVIVWRRLQHPNIVPFLGVPAKMPPFEIVFDWMENGGITEYVRKNPEVDRVGLLWDVVDGLHYLHSCNVIHGNLKGGNILIDKDGHARLTDFGLTFIIRGEFSFASPLDSSTTKATTWAAPEILNGGPASKEGDVFTFAMVVVETFTGNPPFPIHLHAAIFEILSGKRPERPATLDHEGLWEKMKGCWSGIPSERPTAFELLEFFRGSFPRERDTSKTHPLPRTLSTWSLVPGEGHMNGNTEPQDSSVGDTPVADPEPQDPSARGTRAGDVDPPRPAKDKLSRLKRAIRGLKKFMKKFFGRKTPK